MTRIAIFLLFFLLARTGSTQIQMLFGVDSLSFITSPLGVDSLFYWFDANTGVTDSLGGAIATDEGVGTWQDQSGNGHHVTQTTDTDRPVYKATGGPGSKPCIQFDGTDDYLISAAHFWGSDDFSIILVGKFANATRNVSESFITKGTAAGDKRQWILYGGITSESYTIRQTSHKDGGSANLVLYASDGAKTTNFRTYSLVNNGAATTTIHLDAATTTVTRTPSGTGDDTVLNDNTSTLKIGANAGINAFLQGSISEIIVYSKALTSTERLAIENYLNKKYDLY